MALRSPGAAARVLLLAATLAAMSCGGDAEPAADAGAAPSQPAADGAEGGTLTVRGGRQAGTHALASPVCAQAVSQAGRSDVAASSEGADVYVQIAADPPADGGTTDRLRMTLQVGTMNIDTGENPPGTIDTVDRQAGSGTFSVQRDGSAALVTVTGRTGAGADVALTVRCPSVVGG